MALSIQGSLVVLAATLVVLPPGSAVSQPVHPHALFDSTDVEALRTRKDGSHSHIWQAMLDDAWTYGPPSEYFATESHRYGERLLNLAFIHLIDSSLTPATGPVPTRNLLWEYFDAMRSYPEWEDQPIPLGTDLTVSSYLLSLSLTYDWHYQEMDETRREKALELLLEKASYWETVSGWFPREEHLDGNGELLWNWRATFIGNHAFRNYAGIAAVAYALRGDGETQPLIDRLEEIYAIVATALPVDGSDSEGASYHSASKRAFLLWSEMRDRYAGTATLSEIPWFNESILFDLYSVRPGGDDNFGGVVLFGDAVNRPHVPFLGLAGRLGNSTLPNAPIAQWIAAELEDDEYDYLKYLWYEPGQAAAQLDTVPLYHHFQERGDFIWRSSWENDAIHFAIRSGSSLGGHDQPDNGGFSLFRAGVPYLTDYGVSECFRTDEHNVILVDGLGQFGESEDRDHGGAPVEPEFWGSLPHVLAENRFFNVVADPTPMYRDESLTSWIREVIGFSGVFIIRDEIAGSEPMMVDYLLHSVKTEPWNGMGDVDIQYQPSYPFDANPWALISAGEFSVDTREGEEPLLMTDLSADAWVTSLEPSRYIPKTLPGGGNNEVRGCRKDAFVMLGGRFRKTLTAAELNSLVVCRFDPDLLAEDLSTESGQVMRVVNPGEQAQVAVVLWPKTETKSSISVFAVQGEMAGIGADSLEFFVREVTTFQNRITGSNFVLSDQPVSAYVRHAVGGENGVIVLQTTADSTTVRLFCPDEPTQLLANGFDFTNYRWSGGLIRFADLPAGEYRFEIVPPAAGRLANAAGLSAAGSGGSFLLQNHPNPFNPVTTITFGVGEEGDVELVVYNLLGQRVASLVEQKLPSGLHSRQWDASAHPSGIYFYRLRSGGVTETKRLLLLR